jgi:uncharacterized membrane protein
VTPATLSAAVMAATGAALIATMLAAMSPSALASTPSQAGAARAPVAATGQAADPSRSSVAPAPQAVVPLALRCTGNEPGWRLDAGRDGALLSRPEGAAGLERAAEERFRGAPVPLDFLDPPWIVWRGAAVRDARRVLALSARREACSDTMADGPPSGWRAVLSLPDGAALAGCCTVRRGYDLARSPTAEPRAKPADDWSRLLPALAPAVRRCTIDAGVAVERISKAWPTDRGTVTLRLVDLRGGLHDCSVDPSGSGVVALRAVSPEAPALPGADAPRFLPAREASPIIACGRVERVVDAGARLLGWLHYDACDADGTAPVPAPR